MADHGAGPELIVRAVIIHDGCVLANHAHRHAATAYYALPGGHVEPGESCIEALRRELLEELEADIQVGELCVVAETVYLDRRQTRRQEVVLFFRAKLEHDLVQVDGIVASPEPSKHFRWLPLADLASFNLVPPELSSLLQAPAPGACRYVFRDAT